MTEEAIRTQPRWYDEAQKERMKRYQERQQKRKEVRKIISYDPHVERAMDLDDGFSAWQVDIDYARENAERCKNSNLRKPIQQTRKTGFLKKETFMVCPSCGRELDGLHRQHKPYTNDSYLTYYHRNSNLTDCDYEYTEESGQESGQLWKRI